MFGITWHVALRPGCLTPHTSWRITSCIAFFGRCGDFMLQHAHILISCDVDIRFSDGLRHIKGTQYSNLLMLAFTSEAVRDSPSRIYESFEQTYRTFGKYFLQANSW